MRVLPAIFAFGLPAVAVVGISAAMTMHRTETAARPQPARFSGSKVVQTLPSLLASPRLADELPVVVVRDEAAASFYDSPAALDAIVATWHDALAAIGADVRVLSSAEARDDHAFRVLVIPSSPCLTVATREAIDEAESRGAGVILTGLTGTYDAACRPIGFGLIVGETGALRASELGARPMTYVTLPSANALTADIPPGARIDLNPGRQVALRDEARDAFYSDYSLQPDPARHELLLDDALTHSSIDGHRVVYWGFELADVVKLPWDRAIARLLVRNSVIWAAGAPLAAVEPWPLGKRAAASIAQDVETGFPNAQYAMDSLRAAGVRSTFYLTTELAKRYERLSRRLAQVGEIGAHSENHRLLGGLPSAEQRERLETAQRELHEIFKRDVGGLRPPEEQFDTATMSGWLATRGSYLFGANDSRSAAPELLHIGNDTLVLVGRVGSDDFAVTAHNAHVPDTLTSIFMGEYERVRALGGHYVMSYHSQVLARPELVPSLASVARRLSADTAVWLAPVGDIAEWWRARAQVTARARQIGNRLLIAVRNGNDHAVDSVVVRVAVPEGWRAARADARVLPSDAGTLRVLVPSMRAGGSRLVSVVLTGALVSNR